MTDYLQERGGESGNALLEAERWLDAALAGAAAGRTGGAREETALLEREMFLEDHLMPEQSKAGADAAPLWNGREEKLPLQTAVEQMERTELRPEIGIRAEERPRVERLSASGADAGPRFAPKRGWTEREAETTRAEQIDRIFQRDSRRYDGGFFLY